jgi:hypothetical protein
MSKQKKETTVEPVRNYGEIRRATLAKRCPVENKDKEVPELGLVLDEASSDSEALEMVLCYVPDAELQILEQVKTLARELSAFGLMALSLSAKSAAVMGDPNCIGCSVGCGLQD